MEIKEGMYVRTNNGYIGKVVEIVYINEEKRYSLDSTDVYLFADEDIVKITGRTYIHGLLDVIKPGDYVNGSVVTFINDNPLSQYGDPFVLTEKGRVDFDKIETVVTKEQFAKCVYEIQN